jgi:hypothetical protein
MFSSNKFEKIFSYIIKMDVNQMATSASSVTLSNDTINTIKTFADILNEANNKLNKKSSESKTSEAKPSESKTSERKQVSESKTKSKSTRTKSNINSEDNQIPSCINRRIGLLYGNIYHLKTKKQTKIVKEWLDELIVKIQLLSNNMVDTDESDE